MKYVLGVIAALNIACASGLVATQESKPTIDVLSVTVPESMTPADAPKEAAALRLQLAATKAMPAQLHTYRLKCYVAAVLFALNFVVLLLVLVGRGWHGHFGAEDSATR